ncbi:transcriptional regulator [Vibrio alginolyticus]|uniref:HVO_A0114 family putative DNA-binding protein n=1 Tax=Vibrio harveyi group TaxID=717610 RepID=UPI001BD3D8E9|nr:MULTISPECIES: transcriptional regulator [Vibrio harveyi group]ELB2848316.1 transcriptional regulator [Vibrio alginolyticus]MBS9907038.1 transcriptional regulator [Vibrio alginolyticus]MBS9984896.1 transcriptional regulator [Vibrio alginolyticus]MCG6239190.1 transcriptional regulator [Vibrio diabolicus]MCQ9052420.1 transcriptional regulator [Vibrio diabolicus]
MKARIGVMSEDLIRRHMISVAAGNISHSKYLPTFWFTSLDEVSKLLCNENIELMLLMSREKPENLAELADISGHNTRKLSRTLHLLSSKGFIQIEKKDNTSRPVALFTDFEIILGKELEDTLQERYCA